MKINLAKSAGFCFGVKRALEIAFNTAKTSNKVYMLGDIVHNEEVVKEIKKLGIKKITRLSFGKNKTLLLRAHGASINTINKARNLGFKIVNATCPMVKEIHKIAKDMEKAGFKIIVIGDKKHDEVHGITGQIKNKAVVIDSLEHIPFKKLKEIKKAAVVVQSTQNMEKALRIVDAISRNVKELRFFNTICQPTRNKQNEIKTLPLQNDTMVVIGSKNSANTKRLYEISKSLNKNTYWVQSKRDLKSRWFKEAQSVGVTAGASTPDATTKEILKYIKQISN